MRVGSIVYVDRWPPFRSSTTGRWLLLIGETDNEARPFYAAPISRNAAAHLPPHQAINMPSDIMPSMYVETSDDGVLPVNPSKLIVEDQHGRQIKQVGISLNEMDLYIDDDSVQIISRRCGVIPLEELDAFIDRQIHDGLMAYFSRSQDDQELIDPV